MPRETLTGSRIRERRLMAGLRQAELARDVGISASYLNLIEHNRRRIGGKLLVNIAQVLGVEPSMLTEGAEAALVTALREAAADTGPTTAETERADEFAGRFPGWAELLTATHRRVASLESAVQTLSDRLTHDPHLAASLHEVLSTAAAIRSTASILAETGELEPEWRDRFHRNLNQDSLRLAESSRALVNFLDESDGGADRRGVPQEEVDAFLQARDFYFSEIEEGTANPADLVADAPELTSRAARALAEQALAQYAADAAALPLAPFAQALESHGPDPVALARVTGGDLPAVFRRLACLPSSVAGRDIGLVVADMSGSILFRKPVSDFTIPRFGGSCPLWPLFTAFSRPLLPVRRRVAQVGHSALRFDCLAVSWSLQPPEFDSDPLYHGAMLILPVSGDDAAPEADQVVGSSCRVCSRIPCSARREPSILSEEF